MFTRRASWKHVIIGASMVTASCGGSPATPTAPNPPANVPSVMVGTVVALRSAENDQPVGGASISLSGQSAGGAFTQTFTSNAAGQFTLDRTVFLSPTPLLEVTAGGFVVRFTTLRLDETTLSLWPASSSTGLDEAFSSTIVYSSSACPAANTGLSPLRRASASTETVQVTFGSSLMPDASAQAGTPVGNRPSQCGDRRRRAVRIHRGATHRSLIRGGDRSRPRHVFRGC